MVIEEASTIIVKKKLFLHEMVCDQLVKLGGGGATRG